MHDLGKIGIPDRVLLKPDRLTRDEWEIMKTHSRIGYEILHDSPSQYLRMGATIAHAHHEKLDGSGYPHGIRGESIPEIPQDEERATEAPAPRDEDCELVWDWPVDDVIARVRAAAPHSPAAPGKSARSSCASHPPASHGSTACHTSPPCKNPRPAPPPTTPAETTGPATTSKAPHPSSETSTPPPTAHSNTPHSPASSAPKSSPHTRSPTTHPHRL
jgi:hypothetical protein